MQRLQHRADFERVLGAGAAAVVARSAHFVVHHLPPAAAGCAPSAGSSSQEKAELSTAPVTSTAPVVDRGRTSPGGEAPGLGPARVGVVVPKRWARRSVTRSLVKRQVFAAFDRLPPPVPAGDWVVRLRASFDPRLFASAASDALKRAVRGELDALLAQALARLARSGPGRPPVR